jgi:type 1 fimbria pilin
MALPDGTRLPLNKATPALPLVQGTTTLAFTSYIQGEPAALNRHTITRGPFTAVATFTLNYD